MSSIKVTNDVWQLGKDTTASDFHQNVKDKGIGECWFLRGEVNAVKALTFVCQAMTISYDDVVDDQNQYLLEIDNLSSQLNVLNGNIQSKIEALQEEIKTIQKEIKQLQEKEKNGTITEEERELLKEKCGELYTKQEEIFNLTGESEKSTKDGINSIKSKHVEMQNSYKTRAKIATDYGETTVEKGKPLAETEVKGGFFRSLFGSTGRYEKEAGEQAVQAGNELLDKANGSLETANEINRKLSAFSSVKGVAAAKG